MPGILGLVSTESFAADRFTNIRRSVFYHYPNGAAPMTGLLSLTDEETTNDPEFSWWEKRLANQRTLTITQGGAVGPFQNAAGADLGDPVTLTAPADTGATATQYRVKVASTEQFRVGHMIKINVNLSGGTAKGEVKGRVTTIVDSTTLQFYVVVTRANIDNGVGGAGENVGQEVLIIGSAFGQGMIGPNDQVWNTPAQFSNFTQIFRTPFSISVSAMLTAAKYDQTGPYKDKAKEHSIYHMIEMEKAFLFGSKKKYVPVASNNQGDPTTGVGLPHYFTGGILHFMERWEAGDYGTVSASTDASDDKRIIENAAGTLSEKQYDGYLERCFRVTNNTGNEKLVFCGSGFLATMNQLYRSKSVLNADLPMTETYGMNVVKHVTPFGVIYYKTHPLFTQNPILRYAALFVDVKNLKYRYLPGRDTELLKEREPNDADYRKDEWLTEAGLEMRFPESFMFLKNVLDYAP